MKFPTKRSVGAYVYLSQKWSKGAPKTDVFEIMQWNGKVDSL